MLPGSLASDLTIRQNFISAQKRPKHSFIAAQKPPRERGQTLSLSHI